MTSHFTGGWLPAFAESFGSASKRYVLCSQAQGFLEDYSHERLLLSKNAKNEIWPLLENWLHQHIAQSEPVRAPNRTACC
jgi:hypothetical protein